MKLLKDNWAFLFGLTVLTVGFLLAVHRPQQRNLGRLRAQISLADVAIESEEATAGQVPQMRTQVEQLKSDFRDFDRRLPRQQELAGFLREISGSAKAGQFQGQVIEPGSPTSGQLYDCLPIVMRFDASFTDLASFLEGLGAMTRMSKVERLDVTEGKTNGMLHVQAQINIYFTES